MSDEPRALRLVHSQQEPEPAEPHALAEVDLLRLWRLGFQDLARRLAAGTCPTCGMNRLGVIHRDTCPSGRAKKAEAQTIRQPWERAAQEVPNAQDQHAAGQPAARPT